MNLDDMLNKITTYASILDTFGYKHDVCGGIKPWSVRYSNGIDHIDTRNTEWTAYYGDKEVYSGFTADELIAYLGGRR